MIDENKALGFIALYRSIETSPTFKALGAIQQSIAIRLLLHANHKDNEWFDNGQQKMIVIKRGQLITSRASIKKWFNNDPLVTDQRIRTTLTKLEKLEFLTKEATNHYTLITLCHYNDYQSLRETTNQRSNQAPTKEQPSNNQALTTNNHVNHDNQLKDNSPKSKKRIYNVDSIHYQLAEYLFEEMKKNNPEARNPDFNKWANDIRLMMEIDKRKEEQVRNMITWSQSNDFWKGNILSAKKLRDKYDQMKVQANQPYKNNNAAAPKNDSVKYDIKQSEFFTMPEGYSFDD